LVRRLWAAEDGEFFAQLGFRPGRAFAAAASLSEVAAGLLIALGLFGPIGPALDGIRDDRRGRHRSLGTRGVRHDQRLRAAAALRHCGVGLALTGFGPYSLDAWLGIAGLWTAEATVIVLAVGIIGGFANLALRRPPTTTARA